MELKKKYGRGYNLTISIELDRNDRMMEQSQESIDVDSQD